MRGPIVVVGIAILVVGSILIVLGTNEILAVNDCSSNGNRFCVVRAGGGICTTDLCTIDPFYGQNSIEGIRILAYDLIEIGAVVAIVGAVATVWGARAKPTSKK